MLLLVAAVVVVEPDDVVLAGVAAALALDDHQLLGAFVAEPYRSSGTSMEWPGPMTSVLVDDAGRHAVEHHPVLGAVGVELVGEALAGGDVDALDLVALADVDDVPRPPGRRSDSRSTMVVSRLTGEVRPGAGVDSPPGVLARGCGADVIT